MNREQIGILVSDGTRGRVSGKRSNGRWRHLKHSQVECYKNKESWDGKPTPKEGAIYEGHQRGRREESKQTRTQTTGKETRLKQK